ncbi:unnamed protein product [Amoebophrya sp. A120]|nr:unnamed protein product [Amoebophrya sp. A120]|eukprot:GSA120T00023457001.1
MMVSCVGQLLLLFSGSFSTTIGVLGREKTTSRTTRLQKETKKKPSSRTSSGAPMATSTSSSSFTQEQKKKNSPFLPDERVDSDTIFPDEEVLKHVSHGHRLVRTAGSSSWSPVSTTSTTASSQGGRNVPGGTSLFPAGEQEIKPSLASSSSAVGGKFSSSEKLSSRNNGSTGDVEITTTSSRSNRKFGTTTAQNKVSPDHEISMRRTGRMRKALADDVKVPAASEEEDDQPVEEAEQASASEEKIQQPPASVAADVPVHHKHAARVTKYNYNQENESNLLSSGEPNYGYASGRSTNSATTATPPSADLTEPQDASALVCRFCKAVLLFLVFLVLGATYPKVVKVWDRWFGGGRKIMLRGNMMADTTDYSCAGVSKNPDTMYDTRVHYLGNCTRKWSFTTGLLRRYCTRIKWSFTTGLLRRTKERCEHWRTCWMTKTWGWTSSGLCSRGGTSEVNLKKVNFLFVSDRQNWMGKQSRMLLMR